MGTKDLFATDFAQLVARARDEWFGRKREERDEKREKRKDGLGQLNVSRILAA